MIDRDELINSWEIFRDKMISALPGKEKLITPDREKVIKGLKVCTTRPCFCTDCPYKANCCLDSQEVMEDALALIDTQYKLILELQNLISIGTKMMNGDKA